MATNKNALIRYRTIDKCLQNRHRQWTLDKLIDACSDALYEYEGKQMYVSKRTVQLDLQMMRSDKLGYNAPIICYDRKYYRYEDPDYSITNIPLSTVDMDILTESVEMLRQFKDFSFFSELGGVIQKLEDRIFREKNHQTPIIHIDKNEQLRGLEYLDILYQAMLKKIALQLSYQSFKASKPTEFIFFGYILKEFNNRWFLVGRKPGENKMLTLALDRINDVKLELHRHYEIEDFDAENYYNDTIGVTVMGSKNLVHVELKVDRFNAPYIVTKPLHHSQQLVESFPDGSMVIRLRVHHNFELERMILGFANAIEVLKPAKLRKSILFKLTQAVDNYRE
ncbi:MAG: WYL domain-containing protein [Saprospiraceae bacterium]|nr:WYL domain-containing protein [Saprospiraceae bacterium]